jgi:hypothetical protein
MDIVQRVKNILLQPRAEWPIIEAEPESTASLYTRYLIPLAAIGSAARFIGMAAIGVSIPFVGRVRMPIMTSLSSALIGFVALLVGAYVWALIINALAPTFGGQKNMLAALKLAIYSATPALVASFLSILPMLFFLQLLAAIYGLYLLYIGFPVMMKVPRERAATYTAATVASGIVLGMIFAGVSAALGVGLGMGGPARMASEAEARKAGEGILAGVLGAASGNTKESKEAAAGLVAGMVAAGEAAERAQKNGSASGDVSNDSATVAQSGSAMAAALGAMASGGKEQVTLVDFRVLKELLPSSAGSATRTDASGEQTTAGGVSGSSARGSYSIDGGGSGTVKISDMGNLRGMIALGRMALSKESESDYGYEKNVTLNGQRVHEKWNSSGKSAELTAFVADRFMVEVETSGADVGAAEKLFSSIDVGKLASTR